MTPSSDKRSITGRSTRAQRAAKAGRDRLRRLALDTLEPRTLMSVLPPPQVQTRTDVSNTPLSDDDSPSISVDPLDPMRAVATWTRNKNGVPILGIYDSLAEASYTTDGGKTWTEFVSGTVPGLTYSLPKPLFDPQFGQPAPGTEYAATTDTTVAFDRQHNVYILESQHDLPFLSGALVLQKYDFHGPTPNLTIANRIVHQWFDPNGTRGDQAHTPTMAVDTGVGNGQTNEPQGATAGIVTGPDGNTYVAVTDQNQVQQLQGTSGEFQSIFGAGQGFYQPNALTFNPQDGSLFVSNRQNAEVIRVDGKTGAPLGTFTQALVAPRAPRDMVLSPFDGDLLVSSRDTSSVLRYNARTGAFLGSFVAPQSGGLGQPEGLAFGPDNNLYVADGATNTILRYDGRTGAFLDVFVKPLQAQAGGLDTPRGLVFGPDRNLYVISQKTNNVLVFNRNTGDFVRIFAQPGSDPENDLNLPTSLAFSPIDGNLLVTSFIPGNPNATPAIPDKSEILRYSGSTGTFISSFLAPPIGGLDRPTGLVFRLNAASGHDEILVGSEKTNEILRFDAHTGVYLGPEVAAGSGSLTTPTGFIFAADGTLFASSGGSNEILHYTAGGKFLASITPEPLNAPTDAVLGPDGYLYAVSRDTDSVARYDVSTGKFLGNFVASGSGGLNVPSALAFSPDGKSLLVASSFDSSVLKYDAATGAFLGVFIASDPASNGGLVDPEGLIFRGGNLFVTTTKSFTVPGGPNGDPTVVKSGTVLQYNGNTGAFIKTYTPEPLLAPEAGVIGPDGNLYVSSSASNEIVKYDGTTGKFLSVFVSSDPKVNGGLSTPRGIAFNAARGEMYVSSFDTNTILRYNATTGAFLGLLTPEPLKAPQGTVFHLDPVANKTFFYVANRGGNDVLKYDAATGRYLGEFVSSDPALNGGLKAPVGIAFDSAGKFYVSSRGTSQVLRYNADGSFDKVFASPSADMVQPEYLAFDTSGRLYVGTAGTDEVLRFNADGSFAPGGTVAAPNPGAEFVTPGQGGLNGPEGLVFDPAGNLYVASNFTNQVLKYTTTGGTAGAFVADTTGGTGGGVVSGTFNPVGLAFHFIAGQNLLFVSGGTGDKTLVQAYSAADGSYVGLLAAAGNGGLDGATSLVFSPVDGSLLVANGGTNSVLRYAGPIDADFTGSFTPPTLLTPDGLTLDPTNSTLYVASRDGGRVVKYAMNGATADFLGYQDPEPLVKPQDAVVSPTDPNHFYVVSSGNNEVLRYNSADGSFDKVFLAQGFDDIRNFKSIAFDSKGNLYVGSQQGASIFASEIDKFDSLGRFVSQFVIGGGGAGTLGAIDSITFDATDNLFVSDPVNNVVLRFDAKGNPAPVGTNPGAIFLTAGQGGMQAPAGLSVTGGTLTLVSSGNGQVITYNEATGATGTTLINDTKNLAQPSRAVTGSDGKLYVTSPGLKEVVRYRNTGGTTFVLDGVLPMPPAVGGGAASTPTGLLALGSQILVGDLENNDVLSYTVPNLPLGFTPYTTETLIKPEDVAFASDGKNLFVSNSGPSDILKYDTTGTAASTFVTSGSGGLSTPQGITVGPDGNLYVSSVGNNEVLRYNGTTGAFIDIFVRSGAGGLKSPQGLAFDAKAGLLVVSRDTGLVLLYNPGTGAFLREFTPEPLNDPRGMTFDGAGDLYVASHGSDRVIEYDATGNFQAKFTSDDPVAPQGAVLGPDGNLYVASFGTNQVLRYYGPSAGALAGTFKDVFIQVGVGGLSKPTGLVFNTDGNLYVASSGSNEVLRYVGGTGAFIGAFVKFNAATPASNSINPQGLAVDASGNVYVATGNQVQEYRASSGAYITSFVAPGAGGLGKAEGITFSDTNFDGKQEFYVADFANDRVLQYNGTTGAFVKTYAQSGTSQSNNLSGPTGISFGPDQTLYVSSSKNSEVVRYQAATGSFLDVFVTTNRGGLSTPQGLVVVPGSGNTGKLLVVSSDTAQVLSYGLTNGNYLAPFTPGPLVAPTRVAFGPDGGFYVSSSGTDSVLRYDGKTGQLQSDYVAAGSGDLDAPEGLVFTQDGSLLVASRDSDNILRYKPGTGLLRDGFQPDRPLSPTFSTLGPDGLLYVTSRDGNSVLRYDPATGKLLGTFVAPGAGGLLQPEGLAFGADGNLYVASQDKPGSNASKVIRYNGLTGQFIDTFVSTTPALLDRAMGLVFGPDGNLYVASYGNDKVLQFSGQNGSYLADYVSGHSGGLRGPSGIAFDAAGYLYVGSTKGTIAAGDQPDAVLRYKPVTGNFDKVFVAPGTGGLDGPTALAFDASGRLYVASDAVGFSFVTPTVSADSSQDNRVLRYKADGTFDQVFIGRGAGELHGPSGLTFGPGGNLFVTSRDNNLVIKFDPNGAYVAKLDATPDLYGVAFTAATVGDVNGDGVLDLFATAKDLDSVQVFDGVTGEYVRTFIAPREGGLSAPTGLLFSADGKTLYVSSSGTNAVIAYDTTTGKSIRTFTGGLASPDGLLLGGNGLLYVASTGNNSVVVFNTTTGAVVRTITNAGLVAPKGVAFDSLGNLLVTSSGTKNVLQFTTTGQYLGVYNHSAPFGFIDPTTNKIQNDPNSNNVYIAWATHVLADAKETAIPATQENPNAIVMIQSSDGGTSFSAPTVMNDGRFKSTTELDATPRLTISQGRPAGTLSASDPGVPAGQVTVVWDDFGTDDLRGTTLPVVDRIVTDRTQGGVAFSTGVKFDVSDPTAAIPSSLTPGLPVTTHFALPVSITDPRFTSVGHVDVRMSMIYPDDLKTVQINLIAPDGTRVQLVGVGDLKGTSGLGLQPFDPTVNSPFTIDTIFDDSAPRAINNPLYAGDAPFVGRYRPDTPRVNRDGKLALGPGLSALNGMDRNTANGIWTLEIIDTSGLGTSYPDQRLLDWGLDISSGLADNKDVTVDSTNYLLGRLERYTVPNNKATGPFVLNSKGSPTLPGDYYTGVDVSGINAAPTLASDNTLGSFSAHAGRIYLAYVDGYIHNEFSGFQPGDDTNIYLKYSDDGGQTWSTVPKQVNDDNGKTDGFSEADISGGLDTGAPQFQPSIAVDPTTGTLAVSFYDARYDIQHARSAMFVATSIDGGSTFAPETFVSTPQIATDGITGQPVTLGPIPENGSKFIPGQLAVAHGSNQLPPDAKGFGLSQGLAFLGGRLYPAWASNQNNGASGNDLLDIRVVAATVAGGPRVVSSTMGAVSAQTVHGLTGTPITFNDKTASGMPGVADGTPLADGFVISFDRPVDPATLNPAAPGGVPVVSVTYRDVRTSGFSAGVDVPVNPVVTPLLEGSTPQGPTKFLVRFTPQGGTGTYSYAVGAAVRDRVRTVSASGVVQTGNLMDQNGNAIGGEDPRVTPILGTAPGDVYADPAPAPTSSTTFAGAVFQPPFDRTTQPLIVPGPHIVSTFVPGSVKTPDNLVTDKTVNQIAVVFDRDMDATTLNNAAVLRVVGPDGVVPGPYTLSAQSGQGTHLRTFLVGFPTQQISGTYVVTLASTVRSVTGEAMDTNQNAGLDVLRGDPSAGTTIATFSSNDAKAPVIGGPIPGRITTSKIHVPDNFVVQGVTLSIDVTYPFDPDLDAALIAPDGTRVQLFSNVGQTGLQANFSNTTFDDSANTPIQNGGPPFFGTFNPRFPLSVFKTHTSGGDWTLEITDNGSGRTGTINKWTLNLTKPIPATGLGDPVGDQATVSFRIFTQDPTNSLSTSTWTAVGPAGEGAKGPGLNAEISGRVASIAVDPSDPSGNTVYVAPASGGIWKTRNFLTTDPSGPTYVPLTDFGPTFGINVGSITVFARNNDPNQSIIFAATGDGDSIGQEQPGQGPAGSPSRGDSQSLTARGVGFLRSTDGGASWTLLDSSTNFDATGALLPLNSAQRDHMFVGTAAFKIAVDPKATPTGDVIVYAALSDVDANGQPVDGAGRAGGIWRSVDTGRTWTKMRAGQATDVLLDLNSGTGAPDGNLQILYAAFKGDGIYRSPNRGQEFDLMAGTTGDPLIQSFDSAPTLPVPVGGVTTPLGGPVSDYYPNAPATPNSAASGAGNGTKGRIVLARPALTNNPLQDVLYQGWLYAAVVSFKSIVTADNQLVRGGHLEGLYLTKDFGQNWTRVQLPAFAGGTGIVPSVDDRIGDYDPLGTETPYGVPVPHPIDLDNFGTGNFNISLAVDPNNPNIVYLGGTSQFTGPGLMRIDTTGVADPHAFYMSQTDTEDSIKRIQDYGLNGERAVFNGWNPPVGQVTEFHGPVVEASPGAPYAGGPNAPFDPYYTPYLNLIANPRNPFLTASTIPVTNTLVFLNTGAKAKWTAFDQALKPDTFSTDPNDAWANPTRGVHTIVPMVDPITGKTRLIFGDDNGIFTAVDKGDGTLIGSLGSTETLSTHGGDVKVATGSRNGNLQTAEITYGAAQPSLAAAQASLLKGMFYASTTAGGTPYSTTNVITPGAVGYGDITWDRPYAERSSGAGIATVQTGPAYPGFGSFYRYVIPSEMDNLTGAPPSVTTDFLQRDLTSRTFNLLQNTNGQVDPLAAVNILDVPDGQFPFRLGYNFVINPLSGEQLLISSQDGRVFSTENQGKFWNVIGNPGALDGTNAQALAYGAPDVIGPNLGNLNSFVYAGTVGGKIFVTFNGGGTNGNQWTDLSAGLDGSSVQAIVTNPTRTSHEAYAVTRKGVFHMVDSKANGATWVNITGNLFSLTANVFNDPTQSQARLRDLTSVQADWRYIIPDDFNIPGGATHPMLYVGGEGGVFRSTDNGGTWSFFPTADPNGLDSTPSTPGNGGGLPNALVTDLDLVLGNIDPTNGRPDISTGPNTLMASTYGRGAFTIRLAPIVFPNSKANPLILHLSTTVPATGGSDTGLSGSDQVTNLVQPFIEGLSEQSAFGQVVTIKLYDLANPSNPVLIGTGQTDAAGKFSIQINAGVYRADGSTDGVKTIGVQATDQSGTKGNLATFTFTLDTTKPLAPNAPVLSPANDTGRLNNDGVTQAVKPNFDISGVEATAKVFLFRVGVANAIASRIGNGTLQDPGPLADGTYTYYAVQEDLAGNFSDQSNRTAITVDNTKPLAPPAPDLQAASDSGTSNSDDVTNVTKPIFNVTATEGTASVVLLRKLASAPVSAYVNVGQRIGSGAIQDNSLPAVPDGVYTYAAQQVDLAGNVGPLGDPLTVTIDTQGNGPSTVPDLEAASDTGTSSTDNVTSDTRPFFDVTSTELNAVVVLLRKLASDPATAYLEVGRSIAAANLAVTIRDLGPVPDGVYSYASMQIDLAGNPGPRSAALTVTIDTSAALNPLSLVLDAKSDSGSSSTDQVTNVAAPFFDVATAENNQKVQLYRKASGAPDSTYVAVGSPVVVATAGIVGVLQDPAAPTNGVFVYSVQAADAAGNAGPLGLVTTTVTFDNTPPVAPSAPDLEAASDTGTSTTDNITSSTAPVFDVTATEATATIQLLRKVRGTLDTSYVVVGSITGSGAVADTKMPAAADGIYTYAARQVDLAGNVGNFGTSLDVTVDTKAPVVPTLLLDPADDTGAAGDGITSVTRPRLDGKTEANAVLVLFDATNPARILANGQSASDGTFTLIPALDLSDGTYSLKVSAADVAGNKSTSTALSLTIDTTSPGVPQAPRLDAASDSGAFNNDNVTNVKAPFFVLTASETGATVILYRKKSGDPDTAYVSIGQVAGSGKVQDTQLAAAADGAYIYAARQVDSSGNPGSLSGTLTVTLDTTKPPVAPAPLLDPTSDSGIKGDGITNVKTGRVFNVTATEPTATVQLFRKLSTSADSTYTLVGQSNGSGAITDATVLPDTKYAYAVQQVDLAGNVGNFSAATAVAIDTQPPVSPTLNLASADDTGSKGDGITSVKRPRFTGVTEPGATVELLSSGSVVASATADGTTGTFLLQTNFDLADGAYTIQDRASDSAGNSSVSLSTINLTIDTTAPAVPTLSLLPADDSGDKGDNKTSVTRPHLVGVTDAKVKVELLDAQNVVRGSAIAGADGTFSLQPTLDLAVGTYSFHVRATDAAANAANSSALSLTILQAPSLTPTLALSSADDSNVVGDNITNNNQPRLVGVTTPGATVNLIDNAGNIFGVASADTDGSFTVKPIVRIADGTYVLSARAFDGAGNSKVSAPVTVRIDTTPPAPTGAAIVPVDDSGVAGDFVTNNRRPRLAGKAEPNGVAALFGPTGQLLSAVLTGTDGSFTLQSIATLPLGRNALTVRTSDVAGNVSAAASVTITVVKTPGDFDGDGRSDLSIYDATKATYYIQLSAGGSKSFTFGMPNGRGLPLSADFDGDGVTDVAVFDPESAKFFVSNAAGARTVPFGLPNHNNIAVPADYDGDGKTDFAVFDQVDAKFYVIYSSGGPLFTLPFPKTSASLLPVAGDYNGDGRTDFAVYDQAAASFTILPTNGDPVKYQQFGRPNGGDLPVAADYDGDGKTDLAVLDPGPSVLYELFSSGLNGGSKVFQFGVQNGRGIPVSADYDGDGKTDTTVFDPAAAKFYSVFTTGIQSGGTLTTTKITQLGNPADRNVPIPSIVPSPSSVGALDASLPGSSADFTPTETAPVASSPTISGRTALGFAFGHPDRAAKVQVKAQAKGQKPRARIASARNLGVHIKAARPTAHDVALETLWDGHSGE